jgi:hypothetical protein
MNNTPINRSKFLPDFHDINLGVLLIGFYILFDFGAVQGIFDWVNTLRLPYLVSIGSLVYALVLIFTGKLNARSSMFLTYSLVCAFIVIYSQIGTINRTDAKANLTLFLQYWANYVVFVACIKKPSQYILVLDIFILAIMHSALRSILSGGLVWDSIWLRDENHVSLVVAFAIPFAFFLFIFYKSWVKKTCYLIAIALFVSANVVAASRGGTVAMVVGCFFCWLFIKYKIPSLALVAVAAILVFNFAPPKFFRKMNSLKQGSEEATSFDRVYGWHLGLMMFADHPFLGVGPCNYPEYYPEYNMIYRITAPRHPIRDPNEKRVAHSTPIQWLADLGVVGVVVLLLLQIPLFKNWRTVKKYKESALYAENKSEGFLLFKYLTHANAIGQITFWIGALFLSLMPYPFYWIFIPFSEVCKDLFVQYMEEIDEEPAGDALSENA